MRIFPVMDAKGDSAHCAPMKPVTALISALLAAASSPATARTADNWTDAPQTPGDWQLALLPTGSAATFRTPDGPALFQLACTLQGRSIALKTHTAPPAATLT